MIWLRQAFQSLPGSVSADDYIVVQASMGMWTRVFAGSIGFILSVGVAPMGFSTHRIQTKLSVISFWGFSLHRMRMLTPISSGPVPVHLGTSTCPVVETSNCG